MTKVKRKRLKGNDGRRRRKQRQRMVSIAVPVASCLLVLYMLNLIVRQGEKSNGRAGMRLGGHSGSGSGQRSREAIRGKDPRIAQRSRNEKRGSSGAKRRDAAAAGGRKGLLPMRAALEDPDSDPTAARLARDILSAATHLVNVNLGSRSSMEGDSYEGIVAVFCPLDFSAQKENPPELPMFRDVVKRSGCDESRNGVRVDLREAVELAKEFDGDNSENLPTMLDLKGVVFHESRCGSTLAANSMLALNPKKHRVYSESSPPVAALRGCGEDFSECSVEAGANLLKDIVYMMGRSNDPSEENVFFKFQSVTTRTMEIFRAAFPTTPWAFLYREPIEVLMSQLDVPRSSMANCVRSKKSSPMIREFIEKSEYSSEDLSDEEFCAIHLATLCDSALYNLEDASGLGLAVNYSPDLVHDFLDTIFPKHFRTQVHEAGIDRVLEISGTYSKNRGRAEGKFEPDSEAKERRASQEIRDAAEDFLRPSFDRLQKSEFNIRTLDDGDDES